MTRRIRYFGPWAWRRDGRLTGGWRIVITDHGQRIDARGTLRTTVRDAQNFNPGAET